MPHPNESTVAANVRHLRTTRGLSQEGLAAAIAANGYGLASMAICHLERGRRRITVEDLAALAEALGESPQRLLSADLANSGPESHPEPPPELSEVEQLRSSNASLRHMIERARWALGPTQPVDERVRLAEIRAAVAEHEANAHREQVQALIRAMQRERGIPEEELVDGDVVVVIAERAPGGPEAAS